MSLTHAASVFGISGGISAVQKIVLDGPNDQLVGFQRCRFTSHIMLGDYSDGEGYITAKTEYASVKIGNKYYTFQ